MSFIYLASPYSHPLDSVRISRFEAVTASCAALAKELVPVYSPIVHWHPVAECYNLPSNDEYWQFQDNAMMEACKELWVLAIPGWQTSIGVDREIRFCQKLDKSVCVFSPVDIVQAAKKWKQQHGLQDTRTST